jgi:hypothetical protein
MDGGMVPTVEPDAAQKDKRKGKELVWKEAKIFLLPSLAAMPVRETNRSASFTRVERASSCLPRAALNRKIAPGNCRQRFADVYQRKLFSDPDPGFLL